MKFFIIPILLCFFATSACTAKQAGGEAAASKNAQSEALRVQPLPPSALDQQNQVWQLSPGLLRTQLEKWAARAGYQVIWNVSRDYSLQNSTQFEGNFVDALTKLFTGLQQMGNSFKVIVYKGNKVVHVSEE